MAKKFDLAALMGETAAKLEPEGMQEREIPLDEIEENEANAYAQTDIEELAESIKVVGLHQPLVVWPKPEGGYLLIAGHRRRNALALLGWKTASCRVLDKDFDPALRTLVLHWTNTMARGGGGLTAPYIAQAAKEIEEALKDLQARGVVELPGKLRSYVAEVLHKHESQVAKAKAIDKNLVKVWKDDLKRGRIAENTAYELSQCDANLQGKLFGAYSEVRYQLDAKKIKAHKRAAEVDFAPLTCPEAAPAKEPCTGTDKRAMWVATGQCPGCCHECDKADGCKLVCGKVKQRITSAKDAETRKAERQQREDAFMKSPLAMARRHIKLALAGVGITSYEDIENFPKRWYTNWLWGDPLDCHAPDLDDLFCLADWAGVDPFEMIAGRPEAKIWHEYPAEQPPEAVPLLCRKDNGSYGEYVRWEDGWRLAEDQDCPASVTVTHWTEVTPE